jgi:hypothetical protein
MMQCLENGICGRLGSNFPKSRLHRHFRVTSRVAGDSPGTPAADHKPAPKWSRNRALPCITVTRGQMGAQQKA